MENKLKDAKEAAAMLEAKSASVKKLLKSRMPKKRAASLPARQPPAAKKRKSLETAKSAEAPKPPPVVMADPQSFLGKRVARYFGGEDDKKLFFGTVNEFVPAGNVVDGVDLWSVIYDDGDSEDWDRSELRDYLQLYERNMAEDPKG